MRFTCSRDTDCFLLQAAAKALHMLHQVKQTSCGFSPRACNPKLRAAGHLSPAWYASVGLSGARRARGRACVFMTKGPCCTTGSPMGRPAASSRRSPAPPALAVTWSPGPSTSVCAHARPASQCAAARCQPASLCRVVRALHPTMSAAAGLLPRHSQRAVGLQGWCEAARAPAAPEPRQALRQVPASALGTSGCSAHAVHTAAQLSTLQEGSAPARARPWCRTRRRRRRTRTQRHSTRCRPACTQQCQPSSQATCACCGSNPKQSIIRLQGRACIAYITHKTTARQCTHALRESHNDCKAVRATLEAALSARAARTGCVKLAPGSSATSSSRPGLRSAIGPAAPYAWPAMTRTAAPSADTAGIWSAW